MSTRYDIPGRASDAGPDCAADEREDWTDYAMLALEAAYRLSTMTRIDAPDEVRIKIAAVREALERVEELL